MTLLSLLLSLSLPPPSLSLLSLSPSLSPSLPPSLYFSSSSFISKVLAMMLNQKAAVVSVCQGNCALLTLYACTCVSTKAHFTITKSMPSCNYLCLSVHFLSPPSLPPLSPLSLPPLSLHSQIFDFMQTKDGFLTHFLNHLGTSAMMDLLLQMVATPDNDQSRLDLAVVCVCVHVCVCACGTCVWGRRGVGCVVRWVCGHS